MICCFVLTGLFQLFHHPQQYQYVEGVGFMTKDEYIITLRVNSAKVEFEEFNETLNIWYSNATEQILFKDINNAFKTDAGKPEQTTRIGGIDG